MKIIRIYTENEILNETIYISEKEINQYIEKGKTPFIKQFEKGNDLFLKISKKFKGNEKKIATFLLLRIIDMLKHKEKVEFTSSSIEEEDREFLDGGDADWSFENDKQDMNERDF